MGVSDFEDMTNISKNLREKLAERAEIHAPEVVHEDMLLVAEKVALVSKCGVLISKFFFENSIRKDVSRRNCFWSYESSIVTVKDYWLYRKFIEKK